MSKIGKLVYVVLCALMIAGFVACLILAFSQQDGGSMQTTTQVNTQSLKLPTEPSTVMPSSTVQLAGGAEDVWADHPDGVRITEVRKSNYVAHVMYIKDPEQVYLATSTDYFSLSTPGTRITNQIVTEGAIAGINAGAFNDDGTSGIHVGSVPYGIVISEGKIVWNDGKSYHGFVGMTEDGRLYVNDTIDAATVETMGIRDGCCFGPVLIKDGEINEDARSFVEGINSRTAIGQLADGSIVFLCIDGRQCGSIGATYSELVDLMAELGCVNACALDGGASTAMVYKDSQGLYGKTGEIVMVSSYSLFQASPRRMPTFFMVRAPKED